MANKSDLISQNIEQYLTEHENKKILRFITCGSVDDGKSTLIGRLLYDSKMIFEDQLSAIKKDSKKSGTTGNNIDLALLVDGLQSEREQGITIDVAYRYFSTDKRKFIIADTPGHEQYTRNMATGASTADLAIILIDARQGVLTQTKRHSYIASLLGIKNLVVAINKMDLINFSKIRFEEIKEEYQSVIPNLPNNENINVTYIPISALDGDNIVNRSKKTEWYDGKSLMETLHTIEVFTNSKQLTSNLRFPVQYVNRPHLNFRGFVGTIASGGMKVGDEITILPSRKTSKVKSIITPDIKDLRAKSYKESAETALEAFAPMAVTITLEDEIDISRGDMIVKSDSIPEVSNNLHVMIVWMSEEPMRLNKKYIIKRATSVLNGSFTDIKFKKDINTFKELQSDKLELNDIAQCTLNIDREIALDTYSKNRYTGSFIIIDKYTNSTIGAGMITCSERSNLKAKIKDYTKEEIELNREIREKFPEWECKAI
ncbi:sulfate adenylyltransferase, large subunit [Sulfurimonas gotlandica GD1]|uniref:Sulfate adenylyltransferase subunit 1 n=1 Tax=Sulfurimonas gotlandica (strain DSM 19862 / JCM 16533 / GD1) TaxID=929558 RepID=B6BKH2_SULGG|nr:sulfate adenylyltransferase subunit CysN [Sulfurimonas gotlandica]EDZ62409.1 sulfate adenylate transferase, subunit 1/adenylylsulfate kinase [Sulfurimonas gotlandica GD1]EHP29027.1 sulfate adenylyltransferase, large subunit [Sulfurimonas gotlandica GD1]